MVSTRKNNLHLTRLNVFTRFSGVKCKIYLRFTLSLLQTAVAKSIT